MRGQILCVFRPRTIKMGKARNRGVRVRACARERMNVVYFELILSSVTSARQSVSLARRALKFIIIYV